MKYKSIIIGSILGILSFASVAYAAVFIVPQGGTGKSTLPASQVLYGNGVSPLGSVATGTISSSGGITTTANRYVLNGGLVVACDVASGSQSGCLSSTDWTTFNNKTSFGEAWARITNIFGQASLAPTTTQNIAVNGVGTSTVVGGLEAWRQIAAPYFHATSTTATSTFSYDVGISGMLRVLNSTGATIIGDTTGNSRGSNALDLQSYRSANTQVASGAYATAIGNQNIASVDEAVAIGWANTSSGGGLGAAVAIGRGNSSTGSNSLAIGSSNGAGGLQDIAIGVGNSTSGGGSVMIGIDNTSTNPGTITIGNSISNAVNDALMIGPSDAAKVTISSLGRMGIGTTTPGTSLSIGNTGANTINISPTATSTFGSGLNIRTGCYAINGTCVGGSSFTNTLANGGTATTTFYDGGVVFSDATKLTQAPAPADFFWDNTNKRLGLGTAAPSNILSFSGQALKTVGMERQTTANTAGNILEIRAGSATTGATDKAGGFLNLYSGISTGSGGSDVNIYNSGTDTGGGATVDDVPFKRASFYGNKRAGVINFEIWDNDGVSLFRVDGATGNARLTLDGITVDQVIGTTAYYGSGSSGTYFGSNAHPVGIGVAPNDTIAHLYLNSSATTQKSFVIRQIASQTAALQEWQNSAGTPLMTFTATGNLGIGTTTPVNKLTIAGDIGFYGTIPVLSGCGTSPSITKGSTDAAGEITQGTISTGCVVTFGVAKTNAPFCIVESDSGLVFSKTITNAAITITNIGALSSTKMTYHCIQNNN